jgi:hypothetical protein
MIKGIWVQAPIWKRLQIYGSMFGIGRVFGIASDQVLCCMFRPGIGVIIPIGGRLGLPWLGGISMRCLLHTILIIIQ